MTEAEATDFLDLARRICSPILARYGLLRYADDCVGYLALRKVKHGRCNLKHGTIDFLRDHGPCSRAGVPRLGISLNSYPRLSDKRTNNAFQELVTGVQLRECLRLLEKRKARVMVSVFLYGKTKRAVASELGVHESRVSQLVKASVLKNG